MNFEPGISYVKPQDENVDDSLFMDSKALKIMEKMGYKSGSGLGKNEQGTPNLVEIKTQLGTRGLGLTVEDLNYSNEEWDFSLDNVVAEERVEWLENHRDIQTNLDIMTTWIKEAAPNHNIYQEFNFCDREILKGVINAKNIFDELDLKELCQARARANPFESVRSVFFMNRAALKMANIDAATDFMFTGMKNSEFHKDHSGPYYFADVCAGPGGFTEYVLWRQKWMFKGFGFTLRDENDFKLTDSNCASPATFLPLYGAQGDGNICCPANITDFKLKVLHETDNKGVHFMTSDGAFSVEGNENLQEILSKHIYICQCLTALEVLRRHGHFVTKLFDTFTSFSVGLLYLMYNCFEKVCVFKPNTSRPANSERYLICSNYKGAETVDAIKNYLVVLVNRLWELQNDPTTDIIEIVPLSLIKRDQDFCDYIFRRNNEIAKKQTLNLEKLAAFCRNPLLTDQRQEELRKNCLKYWNIPDKPKKSASRKYTVDDLLSETVVRRELLSLHPHEISSTKQLHEIITDCEDWHYTLMYCKRKTNICNFYAGVGNGRVYRLQSNKWVKVKNVHITQGTLLYGELVKEQTVSIESDEEQNKYSLHVIDALRLGHQNLSSMPFEERQSLIGIYCKAVNHEFRPNAIRVRPKLMHKLKSLCINQPKTNFFRESYVYQLPILGFKRKSESFVVNSVLFLKTNENQSFETTYVLKSQVFFDEVCDGDKEEEDWSMQKLIHFVKHKSV